MSTQLSDVKGITITQYSRGLGKGLGYQVTWGLDRYVSFDNEADAASFQALLSEAIEIS